MTYDPYRRPGQPRPPDISPSGLPVGWSEVLSSRSPNNPQQSSDGGCCGCVPLVLVAVGLLAFIVFVTLPNARHVFGQTDESVISGTWQGAEDGTTVIFHLVQENGHVDGRVEYPTLHCSGSVSSIGPGPNQSIQFIQHIPKGNQAPNCIDIFNWWIAFPDDRTQAANVLGQAPPNGPYVRATLVRTGD
jgi:hypothetical protein